MNCLEKPTVPFYVWLRSIAGQVLIDLHRKHIGMQKRAVRREVSIQQQIDSANVGMLQFVSL